MVKKFFDHDHLNNKTIVLYSAYRKELEDFITITFNRHSWRNK